MPEQKIINAKKIFFGALGFDLLANLILLYVCVASRSLLQDFSSGAITRYQFLTSANALDGYSSFWWVLLISAIAVGIALLYWIKSCYDYSAKVLGILDFRYEGWAIIGWIIPIVSIYLPYKVISEIYQISIGDERKFDGDVKVKTYPIILAWWIVWVVAHLIILITSKQTLPADPTFGQLLSYFGALAIGAGTSLMVIGGWFLLANKITTNLVMQKSAAGRLPANNKTEPGASAGATFMAKKEAGSPSSFGLNQFKTPSDHEVHRDVPDDELFEIAGNELKSGNTDVGTWAKALVAGDGNQSKIQSEYIRLRIEKLRQCVAAEQAKEAEDQLRKTREQEEMLKQSSMLYERLGYFKENPEDSDLLSAAISAEFKSFIKTVKMGTLEEVEKCVDIQPLFVLCKDSDGYTALWHAVIEQRPEIAELLVRRGADLDFQIGGTTLREVATKRRSSKIKQLFGQS